MEEIFPGVFTASSLLCSKGVELDVAACQTVLSELVDEENLEGAQVYSKLSPPEPFISLEGGWCAVHSSDSETLPCPCFKYTLNKCVEQDFIVFTS